MTIFPLYDNLLKEVGIKKRDITIKQKKEFIEKIESSTDQNFFDTIYIIIRLFYIDETSDTICEIPYNGINKRYHIDDNNGKTNGNDIDFDIEKLPIILRHIIYKFIIMYHKNIN